MRNRIEKLNAKLQKKGVVYNVTEKEATLIGNEYKYVYYNRPNGKCDVYADFFGLYGEHYENAKAKRKAKRKDTIVRYAICLPLTITLFPCYAMAYGISNLFKIGEYEDMPTLREFATSWADKNCTVIYPYYLEEEM